MQQQSGQLILFSEFKSLPDSLFKKIINTADIYDPQSDMFCQHSHKIKQYAAQRLSIYYISKGDIIKALRNIEFTQLITLRLIDNHIQSVQGLYKLNAPLLSGINLKNNQITQISTLRKMKSSISQLWLRNNLINNAGIISQAFWHNICLISIQCGSQNQCQSVSFCFKFQHLNKKDEYCLWADSNDRIFQSKICQALSRKYSHKKTKIITKQGRQQ